MGVTNQAVRDMGSQDFRSSCFEDIYQGPTPMMPMAVPDISK